MHEQRQHRADHHARHRHDQAAPGGRGDKYDAEIVPREIPRPERHAAQHGVARGVERLGKDVYVRRDEQEGQQNHEDAVADEKGAPRTVRTAQSRLLIELYQSGFVFHSLTSPHRNVADFFGNEVGAEREHQRHDTLYERQCGARPRIYCSGFRS